MSAGSEKEQAPTDAIMVQDADSVAVEEDKDQSGELEASEQ